MTKTVWNYHTFRPKNGRNLYLLSLDEVIHAEKVYIKLKAVKVHRRELFNYRVNDSKNEDRLYLHQKDINKQFKEILAMLNETVDAETIGLHLDFLNTALNGFFSDEGWKEFRRRLSQALKRDNSKAITLSAPVRNELDKYMKKHSLDTYDQTIDHMLSELNINSHD